MSDSHVVRSHPETPTLPADEYDVNPIPEPCIVTLADPVPAWFAGLEELKAPRLAEYAHVALQTRAPEVKDSLWLPAIPPPATHRADVSDSQDVSSHSVPLSNARSECPVIPNPAP